MSSMASRKCCRYRLGCLRHGERLHDGRQHRRDSSPGRVASSLRSGLGFRQAHPGPVTSRPKIAMAKRGRRLASIRMELIRRLLRLRRRREHSPPAKVSQLRVEAGASFLGKAHSENENQAENCSRNGSAQTSRGELTCAELRGLGAQPEERRPVRPPRDGKTNYWFG